MVPTSEKASTVCDATRGRSGRAKRGERFGSKILFCVMILNESKAGPESAFVCAGEFDGPRKIPAAKTPNTQASSGFRRPAFAVRCLWFMKLFRRFFGGQHQPADLH